MISPLPGQSLLLEQDRPVSSSDLKNVQPYDQIIFNGRLGDIKELRKTINLFQQHPAGQVRLLVINDANELSELMQNTLLKVVEEPPSKGAIILQSRSLDSLTPTLRSRLKKIRFQQVRQDNNQLVDLESFYQLDRVTVEEKLSQLINSINFGSGQDIKKHQLLSRALSRLKQNTNFKLTLDWLLLNWNQELGKE